MENLKKAFIDNHFTVTNEVKKAVEFTHRQTKEIVYLLPNIETTIVLNPETVEGNDELLEKSLGINHKSTFKAFPKRKNNGKDPIHYGYSFCFQSTEELSSFLASLVKK
ncbi:hypothetical protein [Evansella tamaricis]|uniref:Uncharacterized protein n=1 Tax=Evansella tamaricis TaxID=2069301 RepID=A0ABS6JJ52_9BACI|nr:hypothetical protein [Evansella tamaricis]MBU9713676.1 hypothetical protein [Evansella tamaricis]